MVSTKKVALAWLILVTMLSSCRPSAQDRKQGDGARDRDGTRVLDEGIGCGTSGFWQSSAVASNGIASVQDVIEFEHALAGGAGSISNVLAVQLGQLTSFTEKQVVAAGAIRGVTTLTEAVACAMMLLNTAATPQERCLALCDLGYVHVRFADFNGAMSAFSAMIEAIPSGAQYAHEECYSSYRGLAMAHMMHGDYFAQLKAAEDALASAQRAGNREYLEAAQDEVAMGLINTRQFDRARQIIQQRLRRDPGNAFLKMLQDNAEQKRSPVRLGF